MDPNDPSQSTPIVPSIDPNIGDIQEMDLGAITGAYDDIGQSFNQMGQNSVADIANRQQQLIGNNFGSPLEGPMGNYNESTYIEPAVTSAQSTIKQVGTQVALNEGIRRSEEAAEEKLKETQKKYNEWVAEQNRKAAEAAERAANSARNTPGGWSSVNENSISQETLEKNNLSLEDFAALDQDARTNLLREDYERRTGFAWDYKGDDWYTTVDRLYKEFGVSGDAAKDERTGNQTEANKAFWGRADVSKRFGEVHAEVQGFTNGAQIMKERTEYVRKANTAIESWLNPRTPEEKALSFDKVMQAIEITVPVKQAITAEKELGAASQIEERIKQYERVSQNDLSEDEKREMARLADDFRTKDQANVNRLNELLDKAGSHTTLQQVDQNFFERIWSPGKFEVQTGTKIVNEKINAANVIESALGLTAQELKGMRAIKDQDAKEFERILKISNRVIANNYISVSDGTDKADNYFRNEDGELELAGVNEVIIHYMPSAKNDPALEDLRKYLKDPLYMEAVQKAGSNPESASEEDKQKLKRFEETAGRFRQNQLMAAAVSEGRGYTDTQDIYSAVLYDAGSDNDTARGEIAGRQIRDWLNEFRGLARDDQKAMSERYLDLLDKANTKQGGYVNVDGSWTPLDSDTDPGRSSIGAPRKHFQDLSNEQAMALFMIIKKEQDAGEFSNNFLDKHDGADSGAGDKIWHSIRSTPNLFMAGAGFLGSGIVSMFSDVDQTASDEFMKYNWDAVSNPARYEAGGAQRHDQHAYDTFRRILDVQYTADTGEEGWYGEGSDMWTGVKRFGGDLAGFGADFGGGLIAGGISKSIAVNVARRTSLKIASTYGEQLGKNVAKTAAGESIIKNAEGAAGIRIASGQVKTFEEIGSDLATAAMNGRSATNYLKELSPTAFKGLNEKQMVKALDDSLPKGLRGVQAQHRIWQANLRHSNANIAGYTSLMMAGVSSKAIAQASPQALRAAVQVIKEGGKDGGSVFSAASRRQIVADAENKIAKFSDEIASGTNAAGDALTSSELRSLRARIAAQRRRIDNPGSPALAREYGFQSAATVARKLVERGAQVGASGSRMTKYDVARFLAREGSDSARKEAFIKRFMRDEGVGNALFAWGDQRNAIDLETGEHRWEDPAYIAEAIVMGTALGAGIHLGGGPTQSIKRQLVNDRIQRLRNSLVKNGIDPENKAHVRKMNEISRLTRYADRLMDDAMLHAGNPDQVALFKKTAEEAKQASRAVLNSLQEVKGFADSSVAKSVDDLLEAISGRAGYETRLMRTMTTLRGESHTDWVRRTSAMRNLASIDNYEVNARIMKSGFDSLAAARSAAKKELSPKRANEAMDKGLVDGLVAHGVNRKVAEQEIKALRREYDDKWKIIEAKAKEGVISLDSFGGRKRGGYLSPAGMTHTMVDDLGPAEWGLIFERKVNADVAKPTIERQADMGKVISDWLDGKPASGKGHMKVRNPEGMNLVTSLQTYSNMVNSEIYLRTLDENIIRNGDVIVIGAKNVQKAVKEDQAYYTARVKELNAELKSSKVGRNQLADTPEITAKRAEVERLQARLNDLEGVGLGERSVSIAAQVLNVEPNEFASVYKRIAAMLKANKEAILKGGDGSPQLEAFTDGKGNYSRDSVIEATFRHFDNVQPLYDATGGAGKEARSQYLKGVDDVAQATLRHRVGDTDYSKSLVNEAMRNFAETDAGAGIYGLGDVVQYVAERTPLSKKPGDGLDSLEWRKVSNALTRSKADEALSTVKADYEPGSAIHTLAEALDEPRDTQVRLRGSEADLEADMYGEALEYRTSKLEQFERFSTAEKQEALDALDFLLREGSESAKGAKSAETLSRQFNLQEIVAKNNLDDPSFDESPMFSRITDPETPQPTQPELAPAGTARLDQAIERWEREVDELLDNPSPEILDEIVELTGGDYHNWADVPLEARRDIVEAEVGPRPTPESEAPRGGQSSLASTNTKELEDQLLVNHYSGRKSEMVKEWEKANPAPNTYVETDYLNWEIKRDNYIRELTQAEDRIYAKLILKKTDDPKYEDYALSAAERDIDEGVESWISTRGEELDVVSEGYSRDDLPPGWSKEMWDEMEAINKGAEESQNRVDYGSMAESMRSYSRDLEQWAKYGPGSIKNPQEAVLAYAELALKSESTPTSTPTPTWSADSVTDLGTVKIGKKSVPAAALTENGIIMPGSPAVDSMAEIRGSMDEWADRLSSDINNSLKKNLGEDSFDDFTISIDARSAIGSSGDDLGPFGTEIRRLLDDLREARAEGRITAEQHDAAEVGIRGALGDTSAGSRTGLDEEIDFDQLIEERLIEGIESGRPLRRDAPTAETTIPRTPGARLSAFYNELGAEDFAAITRTSKDALKQQRDELSAMMKANKEVHKSQIAKFDKSLEPKLKELAEMKDKLANVKAAGSNPAAYVNRNGMKFFGETNNLQGYSAATTLTEVEEAKRVTQEGFHPIENRAIRKENKRKGAVSRASVQKRQEAYDEITELVKSERGAGSAIDDSDIMIHQGLARVKSMEQKQFSSTQGFQKAALATAGFAKAIQNVQLSAGYSRYNAYSFRYLVSAMMSNPLDAVPLLKTLRESRSIESVNKFYMENQGLFMDVAQKTGDPFYIQSFTDSVSQRAAFDSGYLSRALKVGEGNAKWREQMDLNTRERRIELAEEGNLDTWRNAPKYDSTTAVAVKSGAARRTAKTVANFVEATWDDPTFKRFMPVLSGTLFLQNYRRAIEVAKNRQLKRVTAEAKKSGGEVNPADLMLSQADIDNAIMMAHVRTKIFFHPAAARGMSINGLKTLMSEGSYDNAAIDRFLSKLTKEQVEEITDANQGMNAGKIVSSLFFAMQYKATQIGQIANGIAGVGQLGNAAARGTNVSFTQQGSRNLAFSMLTLTAAAMVFNEINGRTQAWDDPERLLTNLNEIGKFRLGDGDGTPAIDPFFSQFTLLNSLFRAGAGLAGAEGGSGVGKSNPHRGIGLPGTPLYVRGNLPFRLGAIQDEVTSNLLSPFKAVAEVFTNNTYFGGNIWEHATKLDGTPNANYDPGRNAMAGAWHLLGFDTTNRYVKGDNLESDKTSWVGGSGLVQHPYIEAYKAWQDGDYGKSVFEALEMPIKWDNLPGRARSSLNGFVVDTIGELKQDYDAVVKASPGDKAKIDEAYESFTKQAVDVVADWSAKNENVLEQDPKLIAAAQRVLTGFFADHYDDNLMKMQGAYWKASIESGLGADFGWEPLAGESEEDMAKRIDKVNQYFFAERDKERDARDELKRLGFDVGDRWGSSDEYDKYRNVHRNVIAQFEKATKGRINGFENLKASKKNYEDRIKLVDEIYTNKAKARAKKTELAEQHNQSVFDLLAPYVEEYGPYTLEMYDRSGGRGLGDMAAELLIIPADVLWKYGTNRNPEKNYLKDQFGVGWSNNSNLPSDAAFQKSFDKMTARINRGEMASASKILDDIIKSVQHGKYGVTGKDWARTLRYREIINGRIGL